MYLKRSISNGKIYLSFVNGYRDGKAKQKTVKKLGYLEDLKKEFDNPEEHFRNLAKDMSKETVDELIIKIMREYVDRTQFELADETNISRSALQTYEYGIVNYALETLVKIAKYYHFDITIESTSKTDKMINHKY